MAFAARALRGGGRGINTRWEINPSLAGLAIHEIKMRQHYETPAAVVATVRRRWSPEFDAMASPINALCGEYATLEDDVLSMPLAQRRIFVNPAYAPEDAWKGSAGIGLALRKLVDGDVRERGCTLIALLPVLSHADWYAEHVDSAHEVHLITGDLTFPNPYLDLPRPRPGFLWRCRSYAVVIWRPGEPPRTPAYQRLELDALPEGHASTQLHMRRCRSCGRVRMLPRYQTPIAEDAFECRMSEDSKYNSCAAPEWVPQCVE